MCKNLFLKNISTENFFFIFFFVNRFITLYGPRNKTTAKLPLTSTDKNLFERGKTDVFKVSTNYVGPIQKIRIEHDNTGKSPGWFLERVVITDLKDPKINYFCPCSKWLAKDEDDGLISRDLPATDDLTTIRKGNLIFFFSMCL